MINAIGWIFILLGILAFLAFCGADERKRPYVLICSFYAALIFLLVGGILVNL